MGHDVNNRWSLQLVQDHTHDVFWVQEKNKGGEYGSAKRGGYQGGPRGGYGLGHIKGNGGGVSRPHTCFNCGQIGHVSIFFTKLCTLCGYFYSPEHVTEDCPNLLKKWEKKKEHFNMVTVEPHKNQKKG